MTASGPPSGTEPAAAGARPNPFARWWRSRTLHARLALLVTCAVAVAVVAVAVLAFTSVQEIQHHQVQSQLDTDANAIAAQPDQWRSAATPLLPDAAGPPGDRRRAHDLGPRWQILDARATIISDSTVPLPVTAAARRIATGRGRLAEEKLTIDTDSYLMLTVPIKSGGAVQVAINQDPNNRTLTFFGLLLVAGCAVGIGAAALLGRVVARAGLVPVERLTEAVEEVAITKDLTRPITVVGDDEIARLGRSVNSMLAAIDSSRRAQRTLVEDAGHELRTPLTSIRTNIELLLAVERQPELAHRLPPEERVKLLRDLDAQVSELASLTTELVELAREETTREAVEPVELTEVVDAAIARVRIRAPGLTFSTDLQPVTVQGRPAELERMVLNVLDNAAKWSPAAATVHTQLVRQGADECRLTIADSGPGIDEVDLPYVFDRFFRAPAARGLPGSGLGLAIVAQTAAQHRGSVSAQSATPHGTVITIRLPSMTEPAPQAEREHFLAGS